MNISKIEIKNFKSFKDVSVNLNDFNVVIGACAAGKSNFIEAFNFLKDLSDNFERGIGLHGGPLIKNLKSEPDQPTYIKVTLGDGIPFETTLYNDVNEDEDEKSHIYVKYCSMDYELSINFNETTYEILNECVRFNFELYNKKNELILNNVLILQNKDGVVTANFEENNNTFLNLEFFIPKALLNIVNNKFKQKKGLIIDSPLSSTPIDWGNYFEVIQSYNFYPMFCKFISKENQLILNEYGDNLASILSNIFSDEDKKRKFINLVSTLLPYIEDVEVEKILDNQKTFLISEKYYESPIIAPFVSDGTVNIIAIITALYFESGDIILIEEPERNIHPGLFIQLVSMIKEVSHKKQVIMTTHSPELLNYCDLKDIHFVTRDEKGSVISKPIDNEEVREFVDELGIGQVFVDNYLDF